MAGQHEGYALGVDLGTSHTVAVLRRPDGQTRPLLVDGQPLLPSGVYADPDGMLHAGRDAERLARTDPSRYEPHPKRRIDEAAVSLGDHSYRPAELLAATLHAVARSAVEAVGFLPPAVLTCPVAWDESRRQVLADALILAGWPPAAEHTLAGPTPPGTRLLREPVAAARYYTQVLRRPVPVGGAVAVFDLGAGTLDVAVVRNEGADPWGDSGFTVIASGGTADLGGADLDSALLGRLGDLVTAAHPGTWERLTRPETVSARRDQHQLREHVRGAKEMLSRTTVAPVAVPGVAAAIELTREDLELVATPLLRRAVAVTREVIGTTGLDPRQLAGLFLVGGATRTPLVARLLHAELAITPTAPEQPELPVAEGALTDLPLPRRAPVLAGFAAPAAAAPAAPPPAAQANPVSTPGSPGIAPTGPAAGSPGIAPAAAPAGPAAGSPGAGQAAAAADAPAGSYGPGGTLRAGPGGPTPAWPGVPVPGAPGAHGAPGTARPPHRRPALWIALGAVLALAGVTTAAALYLTRDRYPALEFQSAVTEITRVGAGHDRPTAMFTAVLGDRAYLGYPLADERLEVVAVDADTGGELWRGRTGSPARRWAGIVALPGAVAVLADATGDDAPRELVVLDGASGRQRWHKAIRGADDVLFAERTAVLVDRADDRLVGLRLGDGGEEWTLASPRDEYGRARTRVHPVTTDEALGGPAFVDGTPADPWRGEVRRIVQIGADRSVRVVEADSGRVVRSRPNVADHDDLVVAHEGRLYVAADDAGYRLLAYDLASLAEPVVLYSAPEERRRPEALVPCGEERACLLEVTGGDSASTEVVAASAGKRAARWAAPGATLLVPLGEYLLVRRTNPEPAGTLFDPQGRVVLRDRDGVPVRLDAGNLLVFAEQPSSVADDRSVAGVSVAAGTVVELGQLKDVRSASCSWNTSVVACGAGEDFVLHRFAR
ncbi:Hsp70 family protein [Micromonospora deserti]|uniref:Heat-shock protein Hsp70 n=1 Tax=Micromonospora deserti TaxID=2070366 RepID=A0A2W2BMR2_9ACTN|nr:Hsp70 family protein [Micromonospora deserti]PZF87352.1 heat-shock protein Hsp70 [Micromonospora deserti]